MSFRICPYLSNVYGRVYDVYLNSLHDSGTDSGCCLMFQHVNPQLLGRCPQKIHLLSKVRSFLVICFHIFPTKNGGNPRCHPAGSWSIGEGSSRFRLFVELLEARLDETSPESQVFCRWWFPKIGLPPVTQFSSISRWDFETNHPAIGVPAFMESPICIYLSIDLSIDLSIYLSIYLLF